GALGDETLCVEWKAPDGMLIEVNAPTGFSGTNLFQFLLRTVEDVVGPASFVNFSPVLELVGAQGDVPGFGNDFVQLSGPGGTGVSVTVNLTPQPGDRFWFKSLKVTSPVPANYNENISNVTISEMAFRGSVTAGAMETPSDPGQWIRIVDEDTPAIVRAIALAEAKARADLIASLERRIRAATRKLKKARKQKNRNKIRKIRKQLNRFQKQLRALQ
ncbi:MAG: hypothetical protein AAGC68_17710, partial [Verrucomicrobiota bacterium]